MTWAVGHNQPGYLPESESMIFDEWSDAKDYFVEMIKEYADDDDTAWDEPLPDDDDEKDMGSMRANVDAWLRDDFRPDDGTEIDATFTQNDDWPHAFWLNISTD